MRGSELPSFSPGWGWLTWRWALRSTTKRARRESAASCRCNSRGRFVDHPHPRCDTELNKREAADGRRKRKSERAEGIILRQGGQRVAGPAWRREIRLFRWHA